MNPRRPFLSFSVRLDGVWDVIIVLALAGSWIGLLGQWHWAFDLFSHFEDFIGVDGYHSKFSFLF
jgi:hypothetical protein